MANLLTILRMLLAVVAIEFLFTGNPGLNITALVLTLFVIVLDGLDGVVARMMKEESKFGSVFDILGDRVVENLYWIAFAVIGTVPVWVPMVVVSRGIITDGLRSIALSQGYTAFGSSTMMKNKFCHFLTASRFSRAVYGLAKTLVFLVLIAAYLPNLAYYNPISVEAFSYYLFIKPYLIISADILVYITVAMCIIRGIPVIIESKRFLTDDKN